jgi:hypothetical protein
MVMKRTHLLANLSLVGVLSVGVAMTSGCGRSDESEAAREAGATGTTDTQAQAMPANGQDLTVTGCLTANIDGRSYALTPSDSPNTPTGAGLAMPGRSTVTYELVGNAEDFRPHANMVVTARGREDASAMREAEVEREDEGQARGAQVGEGTPTVETKEEVEVNVRRLHVTSVVASGSECPSLGPSDGTATGAAPTGGATRPGGKQ